MTTTSFIHAGILYRDDGETMEWFRKITWGRWEWEPVKGFTARKLRRIIAMRSHRTSEE